MAKTTKAQAKVMTELQTRVDAAIKQRNRVAGQSFPGLFERGFDGFFKNVREAMELQGYDFDQLVEDSIKAGFLSTARDGAPYFTKRNPKTGRSWNLGRLIGTKPFTAPEKKADSKKAAK